MLSDHLTERFDSVQSRLSPQALTKIIIATSMARRQELDSDSPSDKVLDRYGQFLRQGADASTALGQSPQSMESALRDVSRSTLFI